MAIRLTVEEWLKIIHEADSFEGTIKEFCSLKGINGYAQIVQNHLKLKPMDSSTIYIFCNSHHDKLKSLY